MRVYLAHHANAYSADENPDRPLTPLGEQQADRIGAHLKAAGIAPARILHSAKLWTRQSAERVAAVLGRPELAGMPAYAITNDAPVEPFCAAVADGGGDVVMTGHSEFLQRAGSRLLCGDEAAKAIEFKPGNGAVFCLEGEGGDWSVAYALRQEHMGG